MAERVNGIVKNEFDPKVIYKDHLQAKKAIDKIILIYNTKRPHLSLAYMTPEQAHQGSGYIKKAWKSYPKKYKRETDISEDVE